MKRTLLVISAYILGAVLLTLLLQLSDMYIFPGNGVDPLWAHAVQAVVTLAIVAVVALTLPRHILERRD